MEKQKQIAPCLTGGIGNRLFQAVAAIGMAEKYGREFVFFLPRINKCEHGGWDFFKTLFSDHSDSDSPKKNIRWIETSSSWEEYEQNSGKLDILEKEGLVVSKGFYQDLKYFPSFTNTLMPELRSDNKPEKDSLAIHFRFGDYCVLKHHQLPLGAYYAQMLNRYPKDTHITLFSDSAKKLLAIQRELIQKGYTNVEIFDGDEKETFEEISRCKKGCIGSNSTFSWWACYFAWRRFGDGYKAIFPTPWLRSIGHINLFTLPYTEAIDIDKLEEFPRLHSFSY